MTRRWPYTLELPDGRRYQQAAHLDAWTTEGGRELDADAQSLADALADAHAEIDRLQGIAAQIGTLADEIRGEMRETMPEPAKMQHSPPCSHPPKLWQWHAATDTVRCACGENMERSLFFRIRPPRPF